MAGTHWCFSPELWQPVARELYADLQAVLGVARTVPAYGGRAYATTAQHTLPLPPRLSNGSTSLGSAELGHRRPHRHYPLLLKGGGGEARDVSWRFTARASRGGYFTALTHATRLRSRVTGHATGSVLGMPHGRFSWYFVESQPHHRPPF